MTEDERRILPKHLFEQWVSQPITAEGQISRKGDARCPACGYSICNCTAQRTVAEILAPPPEPEHCDRATCPVCKTIDPLAVEWGMPVLEVPRDPGITATGGVINLTMTFAELCAASDSLAKVLEEQMENARNEWLEYMTRHGGP